MGSKNELYDKVIELLQADNPTDAALYIYRIERDFQEALTDPTFKVLKRECLEQLYFLANEYLQNGNLDEIEELINSYTLIQDDERIRNLRAKAYMAKQQAKKMKEEAKTVPFTLSIEPAEQVIAFPKKKSKINGIFVVGGIVSILIICFICYLLWENIEEESKIVTTVKAEVAKPLTPQEKALKTIAHLEQTYNDINIISNYAVSQKLITATLMTDSEYLLLFYDIEGEVIARFNLNELKINGEYVGIFGRVSTFENESQNRVLIIGDNGANSIGYTEYLLEFNPLNSKLRLIDKGGNIDCGETGRITITKSVVTKWGEAMYLNEYANIYSHYDYNANPILLTTSQMHCEGEMNGYPIRMDINIDKQGNISGKYKNVRYGSIFVLTGKQQQNGVLDIVGHHGDIKFYFVLSSISTKSLTGYGYGKDEDKKLNINLSVIH